MNFFNTKQFNNVNIDNKNKLFSNSDNIVIPENNDLKFDSKRFSGINIPLFRKNKATSQSNRSFENLKQQQVLSITYEEIGLFPRSFNRVFDRFFKQVFSDVENLVVQEYRFYRYLFLTTVKCLFILFFVPFLVNFVAKSYLVKPITEYFWNTQQTEIFLNSYQQKRAFSELHEFEQKLYFESLTMSSFNSLNKNNLIEDGSYSSKAPDLILNENKDVHLESVLNNTQTFSTSTSLKKIQTQTLPLNFIQLRLQQKTLELANRYNEESIEAITNFFADLISFGTLCFLFFSLEIQINITKSFLLEVFFGLDDSKKSLLILLFTDLLVGYHSPNIWELFFQFLFYHYGIPENETTIFLLVATLPVLLDVLFKYLIFRHLNRASPATVATYHAMIE
nr:chloroplast envelope membrane protein [Dictyochloris fragrans]